MSKHTKMPPPTFEDFRLTEEQQLARLDEYGTGDGLTLTNHETEYRLQEISKATAGIKKLLAQAEALAHRGALADLLPGPEHKKFTNAIVIQRLRGAVRALEMVLMRLKSLVSEYELKEGIRK